MLVNGKVWPFLNVEPRLYRFRILNGCNARIMNLRLGGARLWQIGAEGGMWDEPVPVKNLVLAPAERADVIADFRPSPRPDAGPEEHAPTQAGRHPGALADGGDADPGGHHGHPARPDHGPVQPARDAPPR